MCGQEHRRPDCGLHCIVDDPTWTHIPVDDSHRHELRPVRSYSEVQYTHGSRQPFVCWFAFSVLYTRASQIGVYFQHFQPLVLTQKMMLLSIPPETYPEPSGKGAQALTLCL